MPKVLKLEKHWTLISGHSI